VFFQNKIFSNKNLFIVFARLERRQPLFQLLRKLEQSLLNVVHRLSNKFRAFENIRGKTWRYKIFRQPWLSKFVF
jgi:hypothetical protein